MFYANTHQETAHRTIEVDQYVHLPESGTVSRWIASKSHLSAYRCLPNCVCCLSNVAAGYYFLPTTLTLRPDNILRSSSGLIAQRQNYMAGAACYQNRWA